MPDMSAFPLDCLAKSIDDYFDSTGRSILLECTMIEGINDTVRETDALIRFCQPLPVHVELYLLNEFTGAPLHSSPWPRVRAIEQALNEAGVPATFMTYGAEAAGGAH